MGRRLSQQRIRRMRTEQGDSFHGLFVHVERVAVGQDAMGEDVLDWSDRATYPCRFKYTGASENDDQGESLMTTMTLHTELDAQGVIKASDRVRLIKAWHETISPITMEIVGKPVPGVSALAMVLQLVEL